MEESIKSAFKEFADRMQGEFTPDDLLSEAKKKSSPLHQYFAERGAFDPKRAMHAYGLMVARQLISTIKYVFTSEQREFIAPAYVKSPKVEHHEQGYISVVKLRDETDLAREVIIREFRAAAAALNRAKAVAAALNLTDEIEDLQERVAMIVDRVENGESHP